MTHVGPCEKCKYYDPNKPTGGDPNPQRGTCRRYPPMAITPIMGTGLGGQPQIQGTFCFQPSVPADFPGCWEFVAKLTSVN